MYTVIFKAQINQLDNEYYQTAAKLRQMAQDKYDCLDFFSLNENDQEISISYWPDQEAIDRWRKDPEHQAAMQKGKSKWYCSYEVKILQIERSYDSCGAAFEAHARAISSRPRAQSGGSSPADASTPAAAVRAVPDKPVSAGIVIFDDVEVLDFAGPFEVFSTTRLDEANRKESQSPFDVFLVSETGGPVTASGGMQVAAHHSFKSCPALDILVVPGGWGTRRELENPAMLSWLKERAGSVELLTSVCTGSMLLGFAGLLENRRATTHWRSLEWMQKAFPSVQVERESHVVIDGNLYTSAGISAGIDMAIAVVERYLGQKIARATADHMEYSSRFLTAE